MTSVKQNKTVKENSGLNMNPVIIMYTYADLVSL